MSFYSDPASGAFSITPNDSTGFTQKPKALYIGTSGDVSVMMESGEVVTFSNASGILPIRAQRVRATGTTASNIIGLV